MKTKRSLWQIFGTLIAAIFVGEKGSAVADPIYGAGNDLAATKKSQNSFYYLIPVVRQTGD